MAIARIQSLDDPRLAPFRSLKTSNATRWRNQLVAEGDKLVERLLKSDFHVESVLLSEAYLDRLAPLCRPEHDLFVIPDDWVQELVGFNFHRGVLACARRRPNPDFQAICRAEHEKLTLVVCPDVQDPENLGAILRISSAFGIDAVVLGRRSTDPFSRRVLRVSMGAAFQVPIVELDDLGDQLVALRRELDVQLWASVADLSATSFDRFPRPRRLALLLGSEGHGLAQDWLLLADRQITIPMRPGVDSLNVAVAAGILLHHLTSSA